MLVLGLIQEEVQLVCLEVYETSVGRLDEVCEKSFQCLKIRISELSFR